MDRRLPVAFGEKHFRGLTAALALRTLARNDFQGKELEDARQQVMDSINFTGALIAARAAHEEQMMDAENVGGSSEDIELAKFVMRLSLYAEVGVVLGESLVRERKHPNSTVVKEESEANQ